MNTSLLRVSTTTDNPMSESKSEKLKKRYNDPAHNGRRDQCLFHNKMYYRNGGISKMTTKAPAHRSPSLGRTQEGGLPAIFLFKGLAGQKQLFKLGQYL